MDEMTAANATAISLFSSGGIGDLALRRAEFSILVSNEIRADRHAVFSFNFPEAHSITADIWDAVDELEQHTRRRMGPHGLTLLYATPPCQGMSKNGRGKLLSAIRAGRKPRFDERNRLIVPTMELARRLQPEIVLLENVPEMKDTVILGEEGEPKGILDFVSEALGPEYMGGAEVVEFANYGVPQRRQRLITVFSRNDRMKDWWSGQRSFMPRETHTEGALPGTRPWVTVRDAIGDVRPLDARCIESAASDIPFHRVPLLDEMKYWWVANTPPERSAFDNQCVECGFTGNPTHLARRDRNGINRASRSTPVHCERCGELLPRPSVERDGRRQLMRGYTSAYKRMAYDKPASTLTRNLSYACSDNKLHPEQNRCLSLHEAFRVHSLDQYEYEWQRADGRPVRDGTIRDIIGESIPPAGFQAIVDHLRDIREGTACGERSSVGGLWAFVGEPAAASKA